MVIKEEKKLEKEVVTGISSSDNEANISLKGIPINQELLGIFLRYYQVLILMI